MDRNFTSEEICSIIKACGESGVETFSFGRLKFSFGDPQATISTKSETFSPEMQEAVQVELTEKDEVALKEAMLAQMEIEDPVAYERLITTTEDLIDSKDGELDEGHNGAEPALF